MSTRTLRIGTRGSRLALWQAHAIASLLDERGIRIEIVVIATTGDVRQESTATNIKRLFVKEIEEALLRRDIDVGVHSAKDMPAVPVEGLDIAAVLPREDPRDAFVLAHGRSPIAALQDRDFTQVVAQLGSAARVGTGSVRRISQLARLLPRASFLPIRGNVDTRVRKLDNGDIDALVLASAGLRRLGLEARISCPIPIDCCVPAPGQGIIAAQIRCGDEEAGGSLRRIHDSAAGSALAAERSLVTAIGGGCQLPLGAVALQHNGDLEMHAAVASPAGDRVIRVKERGPASDPVQLGRRVADRLARSGAMEILDEVRRQPL